MNIYMPNSRYLADRQAVFALGNFDGVHVGHAAILKRAVSVAGAQGVASAAMIFAQHPENVRAGACVTPYITSNEHKAELIEGLGVDRLIFTDFNTTTASLSPDAFVHRLKERYGAVCVVCGFHYHFGKNASGNAQDMRSLCEKYRMDCQIVKPVTVNDLVVSSTYIRTLISQGNMELAQKLLGRPFSIKAPVIEGRRFGRTIGFPTINQVLPPQAALPAFGVYATKSLVRGVWYVSVTNIGVRPTVVTDGAYNIETHIIGIDEDLYGKDIQVDFYKRLRDERHFSDSEALSAEIRDNIAQANACFGL